MALPDGAPAKNASLDEWAEFAISKGVPSYEARNAQRDDLVARFDKPEPKDAKGDPLNPQDVGPGHGSLWDETWGGPVATPATIGGHLPEAEVAPEPAPAPKPGPKGGK